MGSRPAGHRYCRCGTRLATDNHELQCARCTRAARDRLITPPEVPPEFWQTDQFRDAFAAQHIGQVSRAYRTHPYHHSVYRSGGITQTLLGQWVGLRQPHISRIENGPPIVHLDTLQRWARVLRIPAALLWFDLPGEPRAPVSAQTAHRVLESSTEIVARRAELQASSMTDELVAELKLFLAGLPDRYETAGPLVSAPEVVEARRLVHRLLAGNQRLNQRAILFELAGKLSGLLCYMAVNLGNFSAAQAYGSEAFELARFIEHDELSAWVRGTQSFGAYYAGDYRRSLTLAQDGQRYAKSGTQAVRLAVNGEARGIRQAP